MILRFLFAMSSLVVLGVGAANAQSLEERLAVADPGKGASVFKKCRACHTVDEGGPNRVGPNLWGVIGRPVASVESYPRYSQSMRDFGGVWELDRLDAYLEKPKALVPKGTMAFVGLPKPQDRANLIAYLNTNSSQPLSFEPAAEAADAGTLEPADAGTPEAGEAGVPEPGPAEADYGLMFVAPGVEETHAYCTPCHSEMIVVQQGKTRKHWAELFEWMIEDQGMAEIDEPDRSIILDYLAANYNEDRPHFPKR